VTDLPVLPENLSLQLRLNMWFQQDTCLSNTSRLAHAALNTMFSNKWIGKYGPINYPSQSPDLTVLDYYFWGRIKDLVYHERPITRDNMIRRINEAIRNLTRKFFEHSIVFKIEMLPLQNAHFEHLIA